MSLLNYTISNFKRKPAYVNFKRKGKNTLKLNSALISLKQFSNYSLMIEIHLQVLSNFFLLYFYRTENNLQSPWENKFFDNFVIIFGQPVRIYEGKFNEETKYSGSQNCSYIYDSQQNRSIH